MLLPFRRGMGLGDGEMLNLTMRPSKQSAFQIPTYVDYRWIMYLQSSIDIRRDFTILSAMAKEEQRSLSQSVMPG